MLLVSSKGNEVPQIAENLGCGQQRRCATPSTPSTQGRGCSGGQIFASPARARYAFEEESAEALRGLLHRSPREFGRQRSLWTLSMAAEVAFEEGIRQRRVCGERIRATLWRLLGVKWQRAKRSISSPDPL